MKSTHRDFSIRTSRKRRAAYSLAAGAAAAAAPQVGLAGIQYHDPADISINQFNSLQFDVNVDGSWDVRLKNYVFSGVPYQGATVRYFPGQMVGFSSGNAYVSALSAGEVIGPGTIGPSYFGSMAHGAVNPNAEFNNVTNAFIGFSFPIIPNTRHYGWARVDVNNAAGTFIVKDWAYQDVTGVAIRAGEIPEPGSLGLLAAGAAGVAVLRRRRCVTA